MPDPAAHLEFLQTELRWVQRVRASKNPAMLHLVEPAVARERELMAEIAEIEQACRLPMAAERQEPL